MSFKTEDDVIVQPILMFKRSTQELKAIIGEFENMIKYHTENLPSEKGKVRAVLEGKLPNCGMWYLRDRGIVKWYLENGWLFTEVGNGKRIWALTEKYISDGVPEKEAALEALQEKREYAKAKEIVSREEIIKTIQL